MLAAHVGLDRGVDVEAADAHGLEGDDAAEADDRRLAGAAADVDDHVADRFVDRQVGADGCGHRLLDQLRVGGAGPAGGVGDGAALDLGDRRRHADDHLRPGEAADADALQQQADHPLGDLEVGDRAAAQRTHGDDVAGRAADHLPRLATGGQHLAGLAVEGDDRRLVEHDAAALHVDERVRRPEVDGEVTCHWTSSLRQVPCRRRRRRASSDAHPIDVSRRASGDSASMWRRKLDDVRVLATVDASAATTTTTISDGGDATTHDDHERPSPADAHRCASTRLVRAGAPVGAVGPHLVLPDRRAAFSASIAKRAASNASARCGATPRRRPRLSASSQPPAAVQQHDAPGVAASAPQLGADRGEPRHDLLLVGLVGEVLDAARGLVARGRERCR